MRLKLLLACIRSDEQKANHWSSKFQLYTKKDEWPFGKSLVQTDRSENYKFQAELYQNKHHKFRIDATYRQLYVYNTQVLQQTPDNSLLGRAEYTVNAGKGFLTGNALYEMGSGQEQRDRLFLRLKRLQAQANSAFGSIITETVFSAVK